MINEILVYDNCNYIDLSRQIEKMREEIREAQHAAISYKYEPNDKELKEHMIEETFDVIQASYTLLHNLLSKEELEKYNHVHIQKMIERDTNNDKRNSNKT
jgi:hypothetical protein